jgi:hypothetical protein
MLEICLALACSKSPTQRTTAAPVSSQDDSIPSTSQSSGGPRCSRAAAPLAGSPAAPASGFSGICSCSPAPPAPAPAPAGATAGNRPACRQSASTLAQRSPTARRPTRRDAPCSPTPSMLSSSRAGLLADTCAAQRTRSQPAPSYGQGCRVCLMPAAAPARAWTARGAAG